MDELKEKTRYLCWEQMLVLQTVLNYCRNLTMAKNSCRKIMMEVPLMIVHGGAGTGKSRLINILSLWVQKLLTVSGDDPASPYIVRCAPTGKTCLFTRLEESILVPAGFLTAQFLQKT